MKKHDLYTYYKTAMELFTKLDILFLGVFPTQLIRIKRNHYWPNVGNYEVWGIYSIVK